MSHDRLLPIRELGLCHVTVSNQLEKSVSRCYGNHVSYYNCSFVRLLSNFNLNIGMTDN